jgi:hypothetical protein
MIKVFQVYKKLARIPKPFYTTENRQSFNQWPKTLESLNGYVNNDELILPIERKKNINLNNPESIIIQDILGYSGLKKSPNDDQLNLPDWFKKQIEKNDTELYTFSPQKSRLDFEIFTMTFGKQIELNLNYIQNSFNIGIPERDNQKICNISKNEPIRFLINGKSDSSMSSRKQRTYSEFDYIIEYLGEFNKIQYSPLNKVKVNKQIPTEISKEINMRKILK